MEPQSAGERAEEMSAYQNRWASCEHGKRNSRVCVECWEKPDTKPLMFGKARVITIPVEVKEYMPIASFGSSVLRMGLPHEPAINQRDHEWHPRKRPPTTLNLQTFEEYRDKDGKGWRR